MHGAGPQTAKRHHGGVGPGPPRGAGPRLTKIEMGIDSDGVDGPAIQNHVVGRIQTILSDSIRGKQRQYIAVNQSLNLCVIRSRLNLCVIRRFRVPPSESACWPC